MEIVKIVKRGQFWVVESDFKHKNSVFKVELLVRV